MPPVAACAVAILAVGTASIFIRAAQGEGASSLVIAAWRLGLATLVLLPPALLRCRTEIARLPVRTLALALLSGLFLAAHFATWITSLGLTSVASSVVIVSTVPLWVALAAPLLLGEPLGRRQLAGVLLAVAGGGLVALGRSGAPGTDADPMLGNALALAGAWAGAAYFMIGRRVRREVSLVAYTSLTYGSAALALLVAVPAGGSPLVLPSQAAVLWCVLLALVPQLVGHSTFNWALRFLPANTVAVLAVGEPVAAIALALVILGEAPGAAELLGCAVILAGITLASLRRPAASRRSDPAAR